MNTLPGREGMTKDTFATRACAIFNADPDNEVTRAQIKQLLDDYIRDEWVSRLGEIRKALSRAEYFANCVESRFAQDGKEVLRRVAENNRNVMTQALQTLKEMGVN